MNPSQINKAISLAADLARPGIIPILANIVIGNGYVRASDIDSQVTIKAPIEGDYTVPAAKFKTILATLQADVPLKLDHKDGKLSVKSGRSKFGIQTLPTADFPVMEIGPMITEINVDQELFKGMLQNVQHAIPSKNVNMVMNGACLSIRNNALTIAATDGARMALQSVEFEADDIEIILPHSVVGRLIKFLNLGQVTIDIHDGKAVFHIGDIEYIAKLVSGKYPDFRRIIPKNPNTILVDRELMLETLARATTVLDRVRSSRITIGPNMEVSCSNNGEVAADDFPCQWTGEPLTLSMNPDFLQEALHAMSGDEVSLSFGDVKAPWLLEDEDGLQAVVIGLRN